MVSTRVGYAGGTKANPTYHDLGNHAESIQIDYDPTRISYEQLLDIFWGSHNHGQRAWSRQYMSAIFYHNEDQRRLAVASKARVESCTRRKVFTEIAPLTEFYPAEGYHQKYWLQRVPELMEDFRAMYPATEGFTASTAAARVNGYLGGYGTFSRLENDLSSFGLSSAASQKLLQIVAGRRLV